MLDLLKMTKQILGVDMQPLPGSGNHIVRNHDLMESLNVRKYCSRCDCERVHICLICEDEITTIQCIDGNGICGECFTKQGGSNE